MAVFSTAIWICWTLCTLEVQGMTISRVLHTLGTCSVMTVINPTPQKLRRNFLPQMHNWWISEFFFYSSLLLFLRNSRVQWELHITLLANTEKPPHGAWSEHSAHLISEDNQDPGLGRKLHPGSTWGFFTLLCSSSWFIHISHLTILAAPSASGISGTVAGSPSAQEFNFHGIEIVYLN